MELLATRVLRFNKARATIDSVYYSEHYSLYSNLSTLSI